MSRAISRRRLLRGLVGGGAVALGLPLLESMLNGNGTALADGSSLPKRFGIFFWGNGRGVRADRWTPVGSGSAWKPSLELAPLAPVKDYVSVLTGLSARLPASRRGHHDGSAAILSGYDFVAQAPGNASYRSTFSRPSIDQRAAAVLGATTRYRSLEVGISTRVAKVEGTTLQFLSHNGPDSPNPAEVNPQALFDRLFASAEAGHDPEHAARIRMLRASVLDGVLEELGALEKEVGQQDRARLEQHTEHLRSIERRLQSDASLAAHCAEAARPEAWPDEDGREPLAERMQAMGQLLALALSCDLTRVFSIQFTGSVGQTVFWQVGLTRGHHEISHEGEASQEALEASTVFTMEQLAGFLQTLRDTPDGGGYLLDHSLVLATSDHSDGSLHSVSDFPVLVAGRAGGALVHPGIHYASGGEHTNQALLSMLRAVGVELAELGEKEARHTSGISAIES